MVIIDGILYGITKQEAMQEVLEIPEEVRRIESLRILKDTDYTNKNQILRGR